MRHFFMVAICGFMLCASPVSALDSSKPLVTTFFQVMNDVPVMPGLREMTDEAVNFDKPEGRIISATAVSDSVAPAAIKNFYGQTLPQLGWLAQPDGSFVRDEERLKLIIEGKEGVSVVRFQLEPR